MMTMFARDASAPADGLHRARTPAGDRARPPADRLAALRGGDATNRHQL